MKDEKDLQGQDNDALELQIDKMIDELFVDKEEPALAGPVASSAEVGASGEEGLFGLTAEGGGLGIARKEPVAAGGAGLQEPPPVTTEEPVIVPTAYGDAVSPTVAVAVTESKWDEGVAGTEMAESGVGQQAAVAAAVAGLVEAQERLATAHDDVVQRLHTSLKENILSLEWEISPQNIQRFLDALKPVQEHLSANPSAMKTVSMMVSVLNYVRRVGRSALPLSIQVLQNGVDFLGMELLPEQEADGEKRKESLATFVDHYRVLKFQIEQQRDKVQVPKGKTVAARPAISPELAEYVRSVVDESVRSLIEEALEERLGKLKQEVLEELSRDLSLVSTPVSAAAPAAAALATPAATAAAPVTAAEEVLTVTLGDQHFNIPKALVANVYTPSPRKIAKMLDTKMFRIAELISFFSSATKGLMGPLRSVSPVELKNRSFDLVDTEKAFSVPGFLQPRQLVLISDGKGGYGLLVDAAAWRTVDVPIELSERMVSGAETTSYVLQALPEEYPFLNVARRL
jgi:hypothetical protein